MSNVFFELPAALTKCKLAVYNLFFPYRKKKISKYSEQNFSKKKKYLRGIFKKKKKQITPPKSGG